MVDSFCCCPYRKCLSVIGAIQPFVPHTLTQSNFFTHSQTVHISEGFRRTPATHPQVESNANESLLINGSDFNQETLRHTPPLSGLGLYLFGFFLMPKVGLKGVLVFHVNDLVVFVSNHVLN